MAFSFGFGGDDIEDELANHGEQMDIEMNESQDAEIKRKEGLMLFKLDVQELLATLPSSLSFRWHHIPLEYGSSTPNPATTSTSDSSPPYSHRRYPRRELSDIRAQIMSTADPSNIDAVLEAGLSSSGDLSSGIYEGGFKTWECSNDLAWWVLEKGVVKRSNEVGGGENFIELGAGTAFPSCVLLDDILRARVEQRQSSGSTSDSVAVPRTVMVLADYNDAVLRMSSFPNMFLTWYCASQELLKGKAADADGDTDDVDHNSLEEGYIEVTDQLKQDFLDDLRTLQIHLVFVAGSWGQEFVDLINGDLHQPQSSGIAESTGRHVRTTILASETIYSPETLGVFIQTVFDLLRVSTDSQAIIAAKRIYFGVGGGVDEFKGQLPQGTKFEEQWEGGLGVGRWIGSIRQRS